MTKFYYLADVFFATYQPFLVVMSQFSNAFSDAILATLCIVVFFRFFARLPFYNRILWGLFLVTTALAAAAGTFRFLGFEALIDTHRSLSTLAGSVGLTAMVFAVWAIVMQQSMTRAHVILSVCIGLILFVFLLYPSFQVFDTVVHAFTMLVVMLIAVFGLLKKIPKSNMDHYWCDDYWTGYQSSSASSSL